MEYVQFIKTNACQSLALIENLLNYSTIDKNMGEPHFTLPNAPVIKNPVLELSHFDN